MLGRALFYGKDWSDDDEVVVYPPTQHEPFWQLKIQYQDSPSLSIETTNMVIVRRNDTIVEVHY